MALRAKRSVSFSEHMPFVFRYPFNGSGIFVLIGGTIFFFIIGIAAHFPILGLLFTLVAAGILAAYMMRVVETSACGKDQPPDWPDLSHWGQIFMPLGRFAGVVILSFGPAWYLSTLVEADVTNNGWFWLLMVWGLSYFPMALLAVSLTENLAAASPHFVLVSIARVWRDHFVATSFLFLTFLVGWFAVDVLTAGDNLLGGLIAYPLSLYLVLVEMRIIGMLYRTNSERLAWFDNEPEQS